MVRSKKNFLLILVSMFCMLTSLFFIGCGEEDKYSNVKLVSSQQAISLYVGQSAEIEYTIENYFSDMDNTINFSIVDSSNGSTTSETQSEHVSLKKISTNDAKVKIEITGVSSGHSSIIATTREGMKRCVVDVTVHKYSQTFDVNADKTMYVTKGQRFYPTYEYFIFDEGTTRRDVKYYYTQDEKADLTNLQDFSSIYFSEDDNELKFQNDEGILVASEGCDYDGDVFTFLAVYSYREIDEDGATQDREIRKLVNVVALYGIEDEDIQIYKDYQYDKDGNTAEPITKSDLKINLVANQTERNRETIYVKVPEKSTDGVCDFIFECDVKDRSLVNLLITDLTSDAKDKAIINDGECMYGVTVTTNSSTSATSTKLNLQLYYSFGNIDLSNERDMNVNYELPIPVNIELMPEVVQVVDMYGVAIAENDKTNELEPEIFYNYYVSDYGWVEYYVNIFKPTSTHSGVKVTFEPAEINIRYNGKFFNDSSGGEFIIEDITKPIYIRGVEGASLISKASVTFTAQSTLFVNGTDNIKTEVFYSIQGGATELAYETEEFSAKQNGIYISSSVEKAVFNNIYSLEDFKYFTVETNQPGIVSIGGLSPVSDDPHSPTKFYLSMDIAPLKPGTANYVVRLDNGVSIALKVTVVNTFEDINLILSGNNPDVVSFKEKMPSSEYEMVIKNNSSEVATTYGKKARIELTSTHTEAIDSVISVWSDDGVCTLNSTSNLEKTIITANRGTTTLTLTITGFVVKDFVLTNDEAVSPEAVREIEIKIISFVPVSSLTGTRIDPNDRTYSSSANRVVVYAKANETINSTGGDIVSNTAYINIQVSPSESFYFYDVYSKSYVDDVSAEEMVYFTLSEGLYAFDVTDTNVSVNNMTRGNSYYISGTPSFRESSYYGRFEYDMGSDSYKFVANPNATSGAVFTIYASIRQFGLKKYYPIQIECREFVAVERIYTAEPIDGFSFKSSAEQYQFVAYLNPYEATVTGVTCVFKLEKGSVSLLDLSEGANDVVVTELDTTTSRAYLITVKMNSETFKRLTNVTETQSGTLYIIPNDWYDSNFSGIDGVDQAKLSSTLQINITYENGTRANPYVLETAEEVMAIGTDENTLSSHYIVYDMIDMSKAFAQEGKNYIIPGEFKGSILGATDKAGFENIGLKGSTFGLFKTLIGDGSHYVLDNLYFSGSMDISALNSSANIGLVAGTCEGKVVNISVSLDRESTIKYLSVSSLSIGTAFGIISGANVLQDFTRAYVQISGRYHTYETAVNSENKPININYKGADYAINEYNQFKVDENTYQIEYISKILVYSTNTLNISSLERSSTTTKIGGLAGQVQGNSTIKRILNSRLDYYNYSGYTIYSIIKSTNNDGGNYVGGVVGDLNQGTISGVLIGGEVSSLPYYSSKTFAGGFAGCTIDNAVKIESSTTRFFVRGGNSGLLIGKTKSGNIEFYDINIQAIDSGDREGVEASMLIRAISMEKSSYDDYTTRSEFAVYLNENNSLYGDLTGGGPTTNNISKTTYITRTHLADAFDVNISDPIGDDEYYGDCVLICVPKLASGDYSSAKVVYSIQFTDKQTTGGVQIKIAEDKKFKVDATEANATYTYYYDAKGYYSDGKIVQSNLLRLQDLLDAEINTIQTSDSRYPFKLTGESIRISTSSSNISVDAYGNIIIKGSGLAVINISSLLNEKSSTNIYLYIVNFFDVQDYTENETEEMFFIDSVPVIDKTEFNVISDHVINVALDLDATRKNIAGDYSISNGVIKIQNVDIKLENANKFIDYEYAFEDQLIKATDLSLSFDSSEAYYTSDGSHVSTPDPNEFDTYYVKSHFGEISKYDDGFFFSKKPIAKTDSKDFDTFGITAMLTFTVGEQTYVLDIAEIVDVKANYYEGATKITSDYSSYVLVTGKEATDTVEITSDTDEELIVVLQGLDGSVLAKDETTRNPSYDYDLFDDMLFNLNVQRRTIGENSNCFAITLSVNKDSEAFKNRFKTNIYGKYKLTYYSLSHKENGVYKEIDVIFEEQDVNTLDLTNYNSLKGILNKETVVSNEYVVPGEQGLITVSVGPIDADFDYIILENTEMNSKPGATLASMVVGYREAIASPEKDGPYYTFNELKGVYVANNSVRVTKSVLENNLPNYAGTFDVKYVFGSSKAENNTPVQIRAKVYKDGKLICQTTIDLIFTIRYDISLKLNGYVDKNEVARGLSYELEVINTGFDATSVEVSVDAQYSSIGTLSQENGKYILNISNEAPANFINANKLPVNVRATYIDSKGDVATFEPSPFELRVLNYVVNYGFVEEDPNKDIIKGMTNGAITTAVGEQTVVGVDFDNYSLIEYNPENTDVVSKIKDFLGQLDSEGTWMSYVDANTNGVVVHPNPIKDKEKAYATKFGGKSSFSNIYFSNSGLAFRTRRTHGKSDGHYIFSYSGTYYYNQEGGYSFTEELPGWAKDIPGATLKTIYTEFTFDSFIRGSDEHPNPVFDYDDLKGMNATGHYILMDDIYITDLTFEPISTAISSLDGNGYKIIFTNYITGNADKAPSVFDMTDINNIGVFSNVHNDTVLKNITVQIGNENSGDVIFNMSPNNAITIGLVAATNSGVITNAQVVNYLDSDFSIVNNSSSSSYIGGLVGNNTGYMTYCQSYLSLECSTNVGGVVGTNSGRIASSFYKGGKIINSVSSATTSIYTAGFAVDNTGIISTSFTSGERTDIKYSTPIVWGSQSYNINSNVQASGFVYSNGANGTINDCYSNLVVTSKNQSAGFVYVNEGECRNDLSFALVNPSTTTDYGFAGGGSKGSFKECYYLRDPASNINSSQNFTTIGGIGYKTVSEFAVREKKSGEDKEVPQNEFAEVFSEFSFSFTDIVNFVWRYSEQDGRLELVDANIIAFSQKEIDEELTYEDENGMTVYSYLTISKHGEGSRENPYVIYSPEKFQSYLGQGSSSDMHYRIVCDLDFSEYETNYITTYDMTFGGYLYGNSMTMSGFSLYSDETLTYAGLFGSIVGTTISYACVKDLTLKPEQVSFVDANFVGTLAGRIAYTDISNVTVLGTTNLEGPDDGSPEDICVVIGKNIVGGLVGYATDTYTINNVVAKISTMAKHINRIASNIVPSSTESSFVTLNRNSLSYSGGIVGFLSGKGDVKNLEVKSSSITSIGSSAGLFFGAIGRTTSVDNLDIRINSNMLIRSIIYGGIITGISLGKISDITINGTEEALMLFSKVPYIPDAVGSVAGYASGGKITRAYIGQSLIMPISDGLDYDTVNAVGGVVGLVTKKNITDIEISQIIMDASITAVHTLGGIVGEVEEDVTLNLSEIAIKDVALNLNGRTETPMIGNFVGHCAGNLFVKDSYSNAKYNVNVFNYGASIQLKIGEIVGFAGITETSPNLNFIKAVENVLTNNTYQITLTDKSIVAVHESAEVASGPSFTSSCKNVFNQSEAKEYSYIQNPDPNKGDLHHRIAYFKLVTSESIAVVGAEAQLGKFAEGLKLTVTDIWVKETDLSGNVTGLSFAFEQDFQK